MTDTFKNVSTKMSKIGHSPVFITTLVITGFLSLTACNQPPQYGYIEGQTMGTSYHIRYRHADNMDTDAIKQSVDNRLSEINNSMSTYQDDSIISKFNALPVGESITVDDDFVNVLQDAKTVYQQSGGAFDPTVMPLINLWGFGKVMTVDRLQSPPSIKEINRAKALIDFDSIKREDHTLTKTKEGVAVDFSAIAKGYGVDVIAEVLHSNYHINNYMVEIGGEVATKGINSQARPWQIAIDAPEIASGVGNRQTIAIIRQPNQSSQTEFANQLHLATSGNYRNSVVFDSKRYSHTIDPTTGQPIAGGAPSVSVVAKTVSLADAWATALTAMPYEKALSTATEQNIAALFVIPASGIITDNVGQETIPPSISSLQAQWQLVKTPAMQVLMTEKTTAQ